MKTIYKKLLLAVIIMTVLALIGYGDYYLWKLLSAGAGVEAKMLCSGFFISERKFETIRDEDIHHRVNYIHHDLNIEYEFVTATAFGIISRKACYRKGLGSTLLPSGSEERLPPVTIDLRPKPFKQQQQPWPTGDVMPEGIYRDDIDTGKLNKAIDDAFSEPFPKMKRGTRAVVVVYNGRIVAKKYSYGFTEDTPLLGYGMSKSVINALIGLLVSQGKVSLDEPVSVPEWNESGDSRRNITLNQLLRMSSGLEFDDSKPPLTDSVIMFGYPDMAAFAANKPLTGEPGSTFLYSNGTTNIISRIIRTAVGGNDDDYFPFPRRALFDRIGMRSAILEPDAAGNFVGSTYMYATARDWARFGMLYLQDGVWEGERILPEGWVAYSAKPAPSDPSKEYGAHFWTNAGKEQNSDKGKWPQLPADAFFALGHDGQSVTIIPSRKLVVVRLGLTKNAEAWDLNGFITDILEAIPPQ